MGPGHTDRDWVGSAVAIQPQVLDFSLYYSATSLNGIAIRDDPVFL